MWDPLLELWSPAEAYLFRAEFGGRTLEFQVDTGVGSQQAARDVAESILPWFAVRSRPEAIRPADRAAISAAIPNRLLYFDRHGFDVSPYGATRLTVPVVKLTPAEAIPRVWRLFEGAVLRERGR